MRIQRVVKISTATLLLVTMVAIAQMRLENRPSEVKIGGLFALTGKWQVGGETEANFAKMAVNEINSAGGIKGRQIKLLIEDDKCSSKDALSAAQKLINTEGIRLIIGPSCTPASSAVAPYADEKEVALLALSTTASGIFDNYNFAFRMSPPADDASKLIGKIANKKYGLKTASIISESTEFGKSWALGFKESFEKEGGKVLATEEYQSGITDFRNILTKVVSEQPELIFLSPQAPQDSGIIINQLHELDFLHKLRLAGNPVVVDHQTTKLTQHLPQTAFSVMAYSDNQELTEKYKNLYGQGPAFQLFYTAAAYDAVYVAKTVLEKCIPLDNPCIIQNLKNEDGFNGKITKWKFGENGDPEIPISSYREIRISNGELITDEIKDYANYDY